MTSLRGRDATRGNPGALRGMTGEDPTGNYRTTIASAVLVHFHFGKGCSREEACSFITAGMNDIDIPSADVYRFFPLSSCDRDCSAQPGKLLAVDDVPLLI